MPRIGTKYLNLGTWADGENPGAGDRYIEDNLLNGNWIKLDEAIGAEHTITGAHKSNAIIKDALHPNCVDGSTLEKDIIQKFIKIKHGGITQQHLAVNSIGYEHFKNSSVTMEKFTADSVDATKISHNNNRTKNLFQFSYMGEICHIQGLSLTTYSGLGYPVPRGGHVTKLSVCDSEGRVFHVSQNYSQSGSGHFNENDRLSIWWQLGDMEYPVKFRPLINGVSTTPLLNAFPRLTETVAIITIEVEFDNV